jgi:hypothetical protein
MRRFASRVKEGLEVEFPEWLLRRTNRARFDAPEIPSHEKLSREARRRDGAHAEKIWAELGQESAEMNTRCGTAAPVSSFLLATAAFLADSGQTSAYIVVAFMAGFALLAAVSGLSIRVGKPKIGLAYRETNFAPAITALKRKEAYARAASGLAGGAIVILGAVAIVSGVVSWLT